MQRSFVNLLSKRPFAVIWMPLSKFLEESIEQARQWFLDVDGRIQVHQLRQFLRTTPLASEESLRALLQHRGRKNLRRLQTVTRVDFLWFSFSLTVRLPGLRTVMSISITSLTFWTRSSERSIQNYPRLKQLENLLQSAALKCRRLSDCFQRNSGAGS